MNYCTQNNSPALRPNGTIVNRPKTFFYPIGWMTVACVFSWFLWIVVVG